MLSNSSEQNTFIILPQFTMAPPSHSIYSFVVETSPPICESNNLTAPVPRNGTTQKWADGMLSNMQLKAGELSFDRLGKPGDYQSFLTEMPRGVNGPEYLWDNPLPMRRPRSEGDVV